MIIETIKGDMVDLFSRGKKIAHGCNCFHAMASGVAGDLAKAFPGIREVDDRTEFGDESKCGNFTVYRDHSTEGVCYNLYTQFNPGRDGSYGKIATAFENLNKMSKEFPSSFETGLYIPKIGAGIAGLEWHRVKAIIDAVTPNLPIILVEWKKPDSTKVNNTSPRKPFLGLDVMLLSE